MWFRIPLRADRVHTQSFCQTLKCTPYPLSVQMVSHLKSAAHEILNVFSVCVFVVFFFFWGGGTSLRFTYKYDMKYIYVYICHNFLAVLEGHK